MPDFNADSFTLGFGLTLGAYVLGQTFGWIARIINQS